MHLEFTETLQFVSKIPINEHDISANQIEPFKSEIFWKRKKCLKGYLKRLKLQVHTF